MSELLVSKIEGGVLTLTLNRPEKMNSINGELAQQLIASLQGEATDSKVRTVVINANGKAFCAGQDLAEARPVEGETPNLGPVIDRQYTPLVTSLREIEKPVIAQVQGIAAGAGANLALCCDFVIAAEDAKFIQAFCKIGLVPDTGGTFILPRAVGLAQATALTMLGESLSATQAFNLGMIYKAVPGAELQAETEQLASKLAAMPTRALGFTKRLLNQSFSNSLTEQLALERELQHQAGLTKDFKEGVFAFLEKRPPEFKGE